MYNDNREKRAKQAKMQKDLIAKAVLAAKDGKRYIQPGARVISVKKPLSEVRTLKAAKK